MPMRAAISKRPKNSSARSRRSITNAKTPRRRCKINFVRKLKISVFAATNSNKINTTQAHENRCKASRGTCAIPNKVHMKLNACLKKKLAAGVSLIAVAAASALVIGSKPATGYVAHEWGTFTSVQGADGVLLDWRPLETTQLPRFVHDWNKPGLGRRPAGALNHETKSLFVTLQRMETPVIYFYSDHERTVDVTVRFPQGLITEWYPQAHDIGPSAFPPNKLATALDGLVRQTGAQPRFTIASLFGRKGVPDSRLRWKSIRVLPSG